MRSTVARLLPAGGGMDCCVWYKLRSMVLPSGYMSGICGAALAYKPDWSNGCAGREYWGEAGLARYA
eukprot:3874521-Rhodomonas_salina.8